MVACFFTWSENVNITRAIKVVGRMGVMISSILLYRKIIRYGSINSLEYKNIFSPILYICYLILGFISFSWSTNPGFSALQWFMTFQSFVFAYFFVKSLKILDVYFEGHNIRLYHLLGNTVFVLQLVFVIGMWINPDVFFRLTDGGEEARLGGTMMNPNELGMLAGVGSACLIFDLYRFKKKVWTIIKNSCHFVCFIHDRITIFADRRFADCLFPHQPDQTENPEICHYCACCHGCSFRGIYGYSERRRSGKAGRNHESYRKTSVLAGFNYGRFTQRTAFRFWLYEDRLQRVFPERPYVSGKNDAQYFYAGSHESWIYRVYHCAFSGIFYRKIHIV